MLENKLMINSLEALRPQLKLLLSLASALQLPRDSPQLEVIKFDGNPRKYAKFIRTFEQTVGAANLSANKKTAIFGAALQRRS